MPADPSTNVNPSVRTLTVDPDASRAAGFVSVAERSALVETASYAGRAVSGNGFLDLIHSVDTGTAADCLLRRPVSPQHLQFNSKEHIKGYADRNRNVTICRL